MRKKHAFTLMELLVVIAIIALLMSILTPSLNKAKQVASAVICQANLHSTSTILFLYANDYNDRLNPDWWSFDAIAAKNWQATMADVMWHYCAEKYWQDPAILFCPTAKKVATIDGQTPDPTAQFPEWGHTNWAWYTPWAPPLKVTGKPCMSSYGVNDFTATPLRQNATDQANANREYWGKITQKGADKIPMAFDSAWYAITPLDTSIPNLNPLNKYHASPYTFGPATLPRHNDKINMVFLDGNLRAVGIKELWTLKWSKSFDTNNACARPGYSWPDWVNKLRE